jgi:hypothetical protein
MNIITDQDSQARTVADIMYLDPEHWLSSLDKLLYIQDSGQNTSVVMIRIRDTGCEA